MLNASNAHLTSDQPIGSRLLRGANLNRYVLLPEPKQGKPLYLNESRFLREYAHDSRVSHHKSIRVGFQESAPIDNWRRLIACIIPPGQYCAHTVRYFSDDAKYDLFTILALFNSTLSEWRFGLTSTNNHVNEYEVNSLPIPRFARIEAATIADVGIGDSNFLESDSVDSIVVWERAIEDKIKNTPEEADAWPNSIHDALSASGRKLAELRQSRQDLIGDFVES